MQYQTMLTERQNIKVVNKKKRFISMQI